MGAVQRIFYYHVATAMASYLMIAVLLFGSVFYLSSKKVEWDILAHSGAIVALMLCTAVLLSGMIWGRSAWNTWWRWEPRLVSFLVLWLFLVSYVALRTFSEDVSRQRNFAAVLGIIAALNVPLVIYSIKLLDQTQQLHPEVVARQGLRDASYKYTFAITCFSMLIFSMWLLICKVNNLLLKEELRRRMRELS